MLEQRLKCPVAAQERCVSPGNDDGRDATSASASGLAPRQLWDNPGHPPMVRSESFVEGLGEKRDAVTQRRRSPRLALEKLDMENMPGKKSGWKTT